MTGALLADRADRVARTLLAWVLDIAEGKVHGISSVVNPEKLGHLGPVADLKGTLRAGR